ncbi:hypothetical protein SLS58_004966 [Diplodia intermedia]|uniref:Uncharacterized protein n=1 Tax=Diplodia intermedia TaxID=856260 RepID=A0ABR3TS17_9PEZI
MTDPGHPKHRTASPSDNMGSLSGDERTPRTPRNESSPSELPGSAFSGSQAYAAVAGPAGQTRTGKRVYFDSDLGDTTTNYTESEPEPEPHDEGAEDDLPDEEIVGDVPQSSQATFQSDDVQPAVSTGNRYAALLAKSYKYLLRQVWLDEKDKRSALRNMTLPIWWEVATPLLASMPGPLLNEIMVGNISLAAKGTGPVAKTLQFNKSNNAKRPAIYNLVLVDKFSGKAPTPNELREMLEVMAKYPSRNHDQLARDVDNAMLTQGSRTTDMGKRKYLETKNWTITPERTRNLEVFGKALMDRLDGLPVRDQNEPMTRPLQQFGWTIDSKSRIEHHLHHESSNYIMGLTESIFRYLDGHGHLPNQYRLDAYPICFLWEPEQAITAEVLFTCIGDGYTEYGGGFAHKNAGENNASADTYSAKLWEAQAQFVCRTTAFFANMADETKRWQEDLDERNKLRAVIREAEEIKSHRDEIKRNEKKGRADFKRNYKRLQEKKEELRLLLDEGILPKREQDRIDAIIAALGEDLESDTRKVFQEIQEGFTPERGYEFRSHEEDAQHEPTPGKKRKVQDDAAQGTKDASDKTSGPDVAKVAEVETSREEESDDTDSESDGETLALANAIIRKGSGGGFWDLPLV